MLMGCYQSNQRINPNIPPTGYHDHQWWIQTTNPNFQPPRVWLTRMQEYNGPHGYYHYKHGCCGNDHYGACTPVPLGSIPSIRRKPCHVCFVYRPTVFHYIQHQLPNTSLVTTAVQINDL